MTAVPVRDRLAAHADWSVSPGKRWITKAYRAHDRWVVAAPVPVGDATTLLARLLHEAAGAPVAFGGDFPLGLPRAYAAARGIANFDAWLRDLDSANPLFAVCDTMDQVSLERPFYPRAAPRGAGQMDQQAARLGLSRSQLRRTVDLKAQLKRSDGTIVTRPGGAPLFWTLGPNQCGKGALDAWKTCLIPAFAANVSVDLWPYAGSFAALLRSGRIVVAETYPAEAMMQLGLKLVGSKRDQVARAGLALKIHVCLATMNADSTPNLAAMIDAGFGPAASGEDQFDSLMGVLCMIRVIDGAPDGVPDEPSIRTVEGWVLGQIRSDQPLLRA
jgi:hypothetical protein